MFGFCQVRGWVQVSSPHRFFDSVENWSRSNEAGVQWHHRRRQSAGLWCHWLRKYFKEILQPICSGFMMGCLCSVVSPRFPSVWPVVSSALTPHLCPAPDKYFLWFPEHSGEVEAAVFYFARPLQGNATLSQVVFHICRYGQIYVILQMLQVYVFVKLPNLVATSIGKTGSNLQTAETNISNTSNSSMKHLWHVLSVSTGYHRSTLIWRDERLQLKTFTSYFKNAEETETETLVFPVSKTW